MASSTSRSRAVSSPSESAAPLASRCFGGDEKFVDRRNDIRPRRLGDERHVVLAVELRETAIRNERGKFAACLDRHDGVAIDMQCQRGAFHLARGFAHVGLPADLQQLRRGFGQCRERLLFGPGPVMGKSAARLEKRTPHPAKRMVLLAPAESASCRSEAGHPSHPSPAHRATGLRHSPRKSRGAAPGLDDVRCIRSRSGCPSRPRAYRNDQSPRRLLRLQRRSSSRQS